MIEDFYDSSALVEKVTNSKTNMGGRKQAWSSRIAALLCRVTYKRVTEADDRGKMSIRNVLRLYCAATSTNKAILESDRITINSIVYQITGIANPGMQDHHLEINLSEVR